MPKHQRLVIPWVLISGVLASVFVAAAPSPGPNSAPEAFKRKDQDATNSLPSFLSSLLPNVPDLGPSSSFGFGPVTTTAITTTTSSIGPDTTSSSSSTRSTTSARFNPPPTPSTPTPSSSTTTTRDALTTTVPTTSRTSSPSPSTSTGPTSTTVQTTTSANRDLVVNSRPVTTEFFTPTYTPNVTQSTSGDDNQTTPGDFNESSSDKGFMGNKGAVGATFTVVGLVSAGLVICAVLFIRKRIRDRDLHKADWDDVNDSASMAEFASASAHIPGSTGATTMLPSAVLAHQPSSRGYGSDLHEMDQDRPDSVLAMPPVTNNERPRDSAYNIVPAAPPPQPPLRTPGDHTSFGSMMGADPFAGGPPTMWQEAERDSAHGPGQAGRGAGVNALGGNHSGYNMQPYSGGMRPTVGGDGGAYRGAAYSGGQQASGYQYAYPSHAYGQQYPSNPQQGGYGHGY